MTGGVPGDAGDDSLMSIKQLECAGMIIGATRGFDRQKERGGTKCAEDLTLRDGKKRFEIRGGQGNGRRRKQRMHKSTHCGAAFAIRSGALHLRAPQW